MNEFIADMLEKHLISFENMIVFHKHMKIADMFVRSVEIKNYTKKQTEPDIMTSWLRLYGRN